MVANTKVTGVTWTDLSTTMSFPELVQANQLIDALEFADELARKKAAV